MKEKKSTSSTSSNMIFRKDGWPKNADEDC
jgi:hypothetical protein